MQNYSFLFEIFVVLNYSFRKNYVFIRLTINLYLYLWLEVVK